MFPDLQPSEVMCDFERALHNAVENTFAAKVVGCFFHFCKVSIESLNSILLYKN